VSINVRFKSDWYSGINLLKAPSWKLHTPKISGFDMETFRDQAL